MRLQMIPSNAVRPALVVIRCLWYPMEHKHETEKECFSLYTITSQCKIQVRTGKLRSISAVADRRRLEKIEEEQRTEKSNYKAKLSLLAEFTR